MPLARSATTYRDVGQDALALLADLARVERRDDVIMTRPLTKYAAYNFRMRIYRWRRKWLDTIALGPDSPDSRAAQRFLLETLGPRATSQWLQLATFKCSPVGAEDEDFWQLTASIARPVYGPDIEWTRDSGAGASEPDDLVDLTKLVTSRMG